MPKNPPRNNQRNRAPRTVQSGPSILQRVMQRAGMDISKENQLLESIQKRLPEGLRKHVLKVVDKGDELVILTDAAAWAARLKLALAEHPDVASGRPISVKVAPQGSTHR